MLKSFVKISNLLQRLRTDRNGVVSFEYVIVAACIVGAVGLAFGSASGGVIATALTTAIGLITTAVGTATSA